MRREVDEVMPSHIDDDQLRAVLRRVFDERRRDRMIRRRVAAGDECDRRASDISKHVRDRSRSDPFHQRGNRRRMTQPRAVIDVVRAEAAADQLLKQIRLFVRALRRTEPRERATAVFVANRRQLRADEVERLVPCRLAKRREHFGVIDDPARPLADRRLHFARKRPLRIALGAANERHRQSLRMTRVIPAVSPLHAQPPVIDRTLASLGHHDPIVLRQKRHRTTNAAIRANAVDRFEIIARQHRQRDSLLRQRARRARCHALAARHAGAFPHRVVEVKRNLRQEAFAAATDNVVRLQRVTRSNTAIAQNAGRVIHGNDRRRIIKGRGSRVESV